jgi:fermentation-respiration switch protein FrsA (DUF1100 family)
MRFINQESDEDLAVPQATAAGEGRGASTVASGTYSVTVVPAPAALWMRIAPPCPLTMQWTIRTFRYTTSSLLDLMSFDATDRLELLDKPLLMIAGSKADSLYMTEDAFAKATGAKDKELFKIDGATHIETYWVPRYVDAAMNRLTAFYGRSLRK